MPQYRYTSKGLRLPNKLGDEFDDEFNIRKIDELLGGNSFSGSPSANRAAIQSALDAGGRVVIDAGGAGGEVLIDGPVYVGDNTTFLTAPGTVIKGAPNTGGKLLVGTKQLIAAWTPVTVNWTAGPVATITWANHGLAVNDSITLQGTVGTTASDWWDCVRVASVDDANTVTVRLPFLPTAAPSGTITAKRNHRNLRWDLTVDYNGDAGNRTVGQGYDRMSTIAAFVADSSVITRVPRAQGLFKYGLMLAGTDNVTGECSALPNSYSDTLKVYGPNLNTRAIAEGCGPEDCLTIQALEPAGFIAYMPCRGNQRSVTLVPRSARLTTSGSGAVVVYTDDQFVQEGVVVDGGEARAQGGTGVGLYIRSGNGFAPTSSKLRDVTVRDTAISAVGTHALVVSSQAERLTLIRPRFSVPANNDKRLLKLGDACTLKTFVIEDMYLDVGTFPLNPGSLVYLFEYGGTATSVDTVIMRRVTLRSSSATKPRNILINNITLRKLILEDCDFEGLDSIARIQVAGVQVVIRGGRFSTTGGINFLSSGTLLLENSPQFLNMNNGVVRAESSGTVVDLSATTPPDLQGTSVLVATPSNVAVVHPRSEALSLDIGQAQIGRKAGNRATNTGTGRGTVPQGAAVVCDGTNWFNATNLSQTF